MPFKNSDACEPDRYSTALFGTGATVGVVRSKCRTAAGNIQQDEMTVACKTRRSLRRGSSLHAFFFLSTDHDHVVVM